MPPRESPGATCDDAGGVVHVEGGSVVVVVVDDVEELDELVERRRWVVGSRRRFDGR